jgi:hypothetical protein
MLSDEDRFAAWPVFENYRVINGLAVPVGPLVKRYNALNERTMYVELLKTNGTEAGILAFMRRYGLNAADPTLDPRGTSDADEDRHRRGDQIATWKTTFSHAQIFDRYVGLVRKGRDWETGEPIPMSRAQAQDVLFQIGIEESGNRALQPHYRLALECEHGWTLRLFPYGLIGLIWKQLVDMLLGNRRFQTCRQCGELFDVHPRGATGSRRNRVFCKDGCRATFGNEKKRHAKTLRARGLAVRDIAREVATDVGTVKKWVREERGRR